MTQTTRTVKIKTNVDSYFSLPNAKVSVIRGTAIAGLLIVAACASEPPPPDQAMQAAETAITTAEQARVADYASPELGQAREKLTSAHSAISEKKMDVAQRLAEESKVDADLALAKAGVAKAGVVNDEMQKSTGTMEQEMQRKTGVPK